MQAIELARRHGWADKPVTAIVWAVRADILIVQGRLAEAELWLERAERALQSQVNRVASVNLHCVRAGLELAGGEYVAALATLEAVEPLACTPATPHALRPILRAHRLHALIRLGETGTVERALAEMAADERDNAGTRVVEAALCLAQADPQAARNTLAPLTFPADASSADIRPMCAVAALLLEAMACDALDRRDEARSALERALDAAEPDHVLLPFLVHRAPDLLERHAVEGTAHAALISEILDRLRTDAIATTATAADIVPSEASTNSTAVGAVSTAAGAAPAAASVTRSAAGVAVSAGPATGLGPAAYARESLSRGEMRVLRYLPTNLSAPEIAAELSLSVNTIRTHMRHVYEKLGAHSRNEAVQLARSLGLVTAALHPTRGTRLAPALRAPDFE
jgi:LuxR family maltose regulon positive regulatory protein